MQSDTDFENPDSQIEVPDDASPPSPPTLGNAGRRAIQGQTDAPGEPLGGSGKEMDLPSEKPGEQPREGVRDTEALKEIQKKPEPIDSRPDVSLSPTDVGPVADAPDLRVVGNPEHDARYWHHQQNDSTCAIVAQEMILNKQTDQKFTESDLQNEAHEKGWYDDGTRTGDIGKLLEAHGVGNIQCRDSNLKIIRELLDAGDDAIACVDAGYLWENPGFIGQGHAVMVTGAEVDAEDKVVGVFLNDSGRPDDGGDRLPARTFDTAWSKMGRFLIRTTGSVPVSENVGGGR